MREAFECFLGNPLEKFWGHKNATHAWAVAGLTSAQRQSPKNGSLDKIRLRKAMIEVG